jgi:hypothetical protein
MKQIVRVTNEQLKQINILKLEMGYKNQSQVIQYLLNLKDNIEASDHTPEPETN